MRKGVTYAIRNINKPQVSIPSLVLKMAYKERFKVCCCFNRLYMFREAEPPESIRILFQQYSENDNMTIDHLHRFLIEVQGEQNASKDSAQAIFNSSHKHLKFLPRKGFSLEIFIRYLLSDDQNGPLRPLGVIFYSYIFSCL